MQEQSTVCQEQPHKITPHNYLLPAPDMVKHPTAEGFVQQETRSTTNARRRHTTKNYVEVEKQCPKESEKFKKILMLTLWEQHMQTLMP